jgi:hypothetical protein
LNRLRRSGPLFVLTLAWSLRWKVVTSLPIDYEEDDYLRAKQEYAALIRAREWPRFIDRLRVTSPRGARAWLRCLGSACLYKTNNSFASFAVFAKFALFRPSYQMRVYFPRD